MFTFRKKIRFSEVDAAGVVFFARAFEFFHMAYEDFMASIDLDLHRQFLETGSALPFVHVEADYKKAMRLGESVNIHVSVSDIGNRSFTIRYQILGDENRVRVQGKSKHVFVDADFKSATLPPDLRRKLQENMSADC